MKSSKKITMSILSIAVVLTLIAGITAAWFTDTEKVNANFAAGVLDISVEDGNDQALTELNYTNMRPLTMEQFDALLTDANGVVSTAAESGLYNPMPEYFKEITVQNDGTLPAKLKVKVLPKAVEDIDDTVPNIVSNGNGGVMVGDPAEIDCANTLADVIEIYLYVKDDTGAYKRVENVTLNNEDGYIVLDAGEQFVLGAGQAVTYVVGARLPETVGNFKLNDTDEVVAAYQGAHFHGDLMIYASQADEGAAFAG